MEKLILPPSPLPFSGGHRYYFYDESRRPGQVLEQQLRPLHFLVRVVVPLRIPSSPPREQVIFTRGKGSGSGWSDGRGGGVRQDLIEGTSGNIRPGTNPRPSGLYLVVGGGGNRGI